MDFYIEFDEFLQKNKEINLDCFGLYMDLNITRIFKQDKQSSVYKQKLQTFPKETRDMINNSILNGFWNNFIMPIVNKISDLERHKKVLNEDMVDSSLNQYLFNEFSKLNKEVSTILEKINIDYLNYLKKYIQGEIVVCEKRFNIENEITDLLNGSKIR